MSKDKLTTFKLMDPIAATLKAEAERENMTMEEYIAGVLSWWAGALATRNHDREECEGEVSSHDQP
jgi:flagellar motor component MotA